MGALKFDSLLNPGSQTLLDTASSFKDPKLLAVKPENGKNNEYEMYLRFLPNLGENARANIYKKDFVRVSTGGKGGDSVIFDMPMTKGYTSIFKTFSSILNKMKKEKFNEDLVRQIEQEFFSSYSYYYAYVYVEADNINPENVGHIKVFRFPYTIYKEIETEKNADGLRKGSDPFNLIEGKRFYFKIYKNAGFAKYDQCKFEDKLGPFMYYIKNENGESQLMQVCQEEINAIIAGQETPLSKFFSEEMNGLERYEYEEPSKDTLKSAINIMRQFIFKYESLFNELMSTSNDEEMKALLSKPEITQATGTIGAPVQAQVDNSVGDTASAGTMFIPQSKATAGTWQPQNAGANTPPTPPSSNATDEAVNERYKEYLGKL